MLKLPKMEKLPEELLDLEQERKLYVEDELLQKSNEKDKYSCFLQKIAVEFVESVPILPLTTSIYYLGKCTPYSGVYLIYYIGNTSLYGGLVSHSQNQPIYVGMSESNILSRLNHHSTKFGEVKDFALEDFAVRFIILDIDQYAPTIEKLLIEYHGPLWNHKKVKFSFGNADGVNNNWNKYHVAKDEKTITKMIERVRKYIQDRKTSAQSDHHTFVNPP